MLEGCRNGERERGRREEGERGGGGGVGGRESECMREGGR